MSDDARRLAYRVAQASGMKFGLGFGLISLVLAIASSEWAAVVFLLLFLGVVLEFLGWLKKDIGGTENRLGRTPDS